MTNRCFRFYAILGVFFLMLLPLGAVASETIRIIPYPQSVVTGKGSFSFTKGTVILCQANDTGVLKLAEQFASQFHVVTGIRIPVVHTISKAGQVISFTNNDTVGKEGYLLAVTTNKIGIEAATPQGFFYALQSLYQLLPADIYAQKRSNIKKWSVPCVDIKDEPRFVYRGLHLDVSRHFFPVEFIKKYIDAMAIHKLNYFHWHLTDDQGWRIQIRKYPLLTQTGSKRVETLVGHYSENFPERYDDEAYGGYYTQAEAREIVAYAASRFITVIPEIEMPGHATAAIAAYPFLSCTQEKIKVATKWGVFQDVFCPRDSTFDFLEDVLTEIMDIFPSRYIHIGGDECPKDRWKVCPDCQAKIKLLGLKDEHELQSYFIHRIEKFLNSKGRKIIGWDEILEGGLAPNATVMSWRGFEGGIAAAQSKHDVIMTPYTHCYFDHYQANPATEPTAIGGFLPIEKVYSYEPVPNQLTEAESVYILGAQANVWTEYMGTSDHVEYMVFPRLAAMSEVLWSPAKARSWDRFSSGISTQLQRYKALNLNASEAFLDVECESKTLDENQLMVTLKTNNAEAIIRYTTDGSRPQIGSPAYKQPLIFSENTEIKAQCFQKDKAVGRDFSRKFMVSRVTGLPVTIAGSKNPDLMMTNGISGDIKTGTEWAVLGGNKDREIILDFKQTSQIQRVIIGMLSAPALRALYAPEITVFTSKDGDSYTQVAHGTYAQEANGIRRILRPELVFPVDNVRYVKIAFKYAGEFKNADGVGNSLLYIDEIQVL